MFYGARRKRTSSPSATLVLELALKSSFSILTLPANRCTSAGLPRAFILARSCFVLVLWDGRSRLAEFSLLTEDGVFGATHGKILNSNNAHPLSCQQPRPTSNEAGGGHREQVEGKHNNLSCRVPDYLSILAPPAILRPRVTCSSHALGVEHVASLCFT